MSKQNRKISHVSASGSPYGGLKNKDDAIKTVQVCHEQRRKQGTSSFTERQRRLKKR